MDVSRIALMRGRLSILGGKFTILKGYLEECRAERVKEAKADRNAREKYSRPRFKQWREAMHEGVADRVCVRHRLLRWGKELEFRKESDELVHRWKVLWSHKRAQEAVDAWQTYTHRIACTSVVGLHRISSDYMKVRWYPNQHST